jgi:hypothetical protein
MRRRRRPKMNAPEGLDQVLARAGEDRFAPNRLPLPPHVWAAAVGARIAERTRPIAVEGGVLIVRAATSVWANELSLLEEALLARVRAAGVSVRHIRFRVGPVDPPERAPEVRAAKVPAPVPLDARLARAIDAVADDELREVIAGAARANLAWRAFQDPGEGAGTPPAAPAAAAAARATSAPRAARAPRDAERETAPPARKSSGAPGAGRGNRGGG